ncbi:MAG: YchF/TatD family DNA exonuclease [Alphaproteobacteria bacterium]|nr:YchF/TatD family DNA exonuclease [Alphaproteobacteria bacterium]
MRIDSHVNLHHAAFDADREAVIARARAEGVGLMITICDKLENFPAVAAIAAAHDDIYCTIGVHPHHAKDYPSLTADTLIAAAQSAKVIAVGETGLDLHYGYSPLEDQLRSLREHIEAARALDLPLVIHTREADAQMGDVLEEAMTQRPFRLLMHCYTSGAELARRALKLGAYFSFSGILTFKTAHEVRAIAEEIPLDRVILETDCPYLTPVPFRGQRCEPKHVADVYKYFLALRNLEEGEGTALLAENVHALFHTLPRRKAAA